jgi:hypothetical protein
LQITAIVDLAFESAAYEPESSIHLEIVSEIAFFARQSFGGR